MAKAARPREVVYSTLKQRIVLNEISPGEPLTELGLARDLECSQGTVREALLRLQEDGLVVRSGHRGTSVTPLDPAAAEEVLDLRKRLETRGAPLLPMSQMRAPILLRCATVWRARRAVTTNMP
jgi:DNA-binding GntR family transcriptional regulator